MDPNSQRLTQGASGGASAQKVYVEDVFSTYLYTGNGSTATITNGIDLSGKGGLVWIKDRVNANLTAFWYNHFLFDSERGSSSYLSSNLALSENHTGYIGTVPFLSNGFSSGAFSQTGANYASWAFRKQKKFFDVVTWTGNGTAGRSISHNLGTTPGMMIVKNTTTSSTYWMCYHRSLGATKAIYLNTTDASSTDSCWNNTEPTSTNFTVGGGQFINENNSQFVAYLFAHDAGGFGDSGNDSVVSCGSYTNNASAPVVVNLGWEPQWILVKSSSSSASWAIVDNMRGIDSGRTAVLYPETVNAEDVLGQCVTPTATGFEVKNNVTTTLNSAATTGTVTYIYIAIRRGPMKTPTDATKVFTLASFTSDVGTWNVPAPVDMVIGRRREGGDGYIGSRLTGNKQILSTNSTSAEVTASAIPYAWKWDSSSTQMSSQLYINMTGTLQAYSFRRAPGFFDIIAYKGVGNNVAIPHNLGVAPQMIIAKNRGRDGYPAVVWTTFTGTSGAYLNSTGAFDSVSMSPTVATNSITYAAIGYEFNLGSTDNYIAYLFATCPGVSKVGSYTGTGTTKDIDCGFTAGARFVLIKRTDSTGDWYVWDTARGVVSGNDPYLLLNSTAAEVTNTDYIDPLSSGFQISSTAPAAINANGGTFIYLAIA